MKPGITATAVGIISALIRLAPGLEGGLYIGACRHRAERSYSRCQDYGSRLWAARWSDDCAGDREALYRDKCRKHGLVHDTYAHARSCSPPCAEGWVSNSH
jgi:hypothetical protein